MIHQTMPRKGYEGCKLDESKGFYIEGEDFDDCINQLREWCETHKEKWVYYHDCGMGPSKPIPVAKNIFEVQFYDADPAAPIIPSRCFQEGCEGKREIDTMNDEERNVLRQKQMMFFTMLAYNFEKKYTTNAQNKDSQS